METKNEQSGGKKDKTRGGIKGSALMQSSAHLSSVGGGDDEEPCNYTVISDRGTERRGFGGLFTGLNGDKAVFKFDTQNFHEVVAQSEREKLKNDFKHI